ncbi:DUF3784 domain-containing protein [Desulfovibrio mangrovi]|uniref:DUF3784 domain-containing protein n=1 Tax=Desulfovibrio mangrovi TaxID=2976983 RepID=UPI002245E2E2|nr:DUF3784 domain-containing protein [Desulfovibrio mangrovi]UZP68963.1 DUF3784 domain-containing protein [Desulfovibrio mangrovi]
MNIGTITCLAMAAPLAVCAILFTLLGEKSSMLISGFNTLSKEERAQYDRKALCKDVRNRLFLWTALLTAGALAAHLLHLYCGVAALVLWLILFLKGVRATPEAAFKQYRTIMQDNHTS